MIKRERRDNFIKGFIAVNFLSFLLCASMLDGDNYIIPLIIAGLNILSSFVAGLFYEGGE